MSPALDNVAVRERVAMFREFYDGAEQFAALLDTQGTLLFANRSACAVVNRALDTIIGSNVSEADWLWNNEEEQRQWLRAVKDAINGTPTSLERRFCAAKNTVRVVQFYLRSVHSESGQCVGLILEGWDITARVHVEMSLEQVRQTLEAVLEQSPVALIVVSASDRVVRYFNRAASKVLGCADEPSYCGSTLEEMMRGQSWRIIDPNGEIVPYDQRPLQRALRGEATTPVEQAALRKDGSICWFLVNGAPVYSRSGELVAAVIAFHDISERKRLAEQLEQMSSEQRAILNTIRLGISLLKNRRFQWVNAAFEETCGYSSEELRNVDSSLLYARYEDYERVGKEAYVELARGGVYSIEILMRRKDGSEFWTAIYGQAIDSTHLDAGTLWVWQDITEHKRQEDALRESERKLKEIFRASPEMIVVSHVRTGRLIEFNDAFTRLTGFTRGEALGKTSLEIGLWLNPEVRTQVVQQMNALGYLRSQEVQFRKKSGDVLEVMIAGAPFTMAGEECIIWIISDITEYKRVQQAVREGEERFKRLVENSNDLIVVMNEQRSIHSLVGPLKSVLGYEFEDVVGCDELELIHPDDIQSAKQGFYEVMSAPGEKRRLEYRFRHKNGNYVNVEAVGCNWLADPSIRGIVWNVREITARKVAELERTRLQEQLQQALKMEAVGRLAGGVAHDFNNLLTVITGNVELARDELDPADPIAQSLAEVAKAADSAASLTKQLLAFSRRQLIEPKVVNINELIGSLQKMLVRLIGEDIELRVHLADDLGSVKVDPGQFDQVIINLVVNARDAMLHGGTLGIETMNAELDELYCKSHPGITPGPYVMLAVTDSGHGMTEAVKKLIFEPFFTTKPKGHGTGLGLAMIFGAVQQAGGIIEVYSEVEQGASFKIYLPRVEIRAEKLERRSTTAALPTGHETVLLVEDEPSVRELAATMLKRLGYEVLSATRGDEAIKVAKEHREPIELLMTDVVMPGMNGREAAEMVQRCHPETRVLFTSGYTEDVMIHHGVLSESLSFISKPYTMHSLAIKLRQVLEQEQPTPIVRDTNR